MADPGAPQPEATYKQAQEQILMSILDQLKDGQMTMKAEPAWEMIESCMDHIMGKHSRAGSMAISKIRDNWLRKAFMELISSLTEVRQIWDYQTENGQFAEQAKLFGKLARAWWLDIKGHKALQGALEFSGVGGSGYLYIQWNPDLPGGGNIELVPIDPRDVLPIGPVYSDSIQAWQGVVVRRAMAVGEAANRWPTKRMKLQPSLNKIWPRMGGSKKASAVYSSAWQFLTSKSGAPESTPDRPGGTVDVLYVYLKDYSLHTGEEPIQMGTGLDAYTVYPVGSKLPNGKTATEIEARLYPRGRLVICTEETILEDMPNPNWHGNFPLVRFTLLPVPWSLLGCSIVGDALPIQAMLNESLRGLEDAMNQWIQRGVVADASSMSKKELDNIDTRRAGFRALVNPNGGEGFKVIDGPTLPEWYMTLPEFLKGEIDNLIGVKNLQQIRSLKQMPSADSLEAFGELLSPLLRIMASQVESSLSEVAELFKSLVLQYYTTKRRVQILGPTGAVLEDFDMDPGSMVPDSLPGRNRMERALTHQKNFSFQITPNTFLAVSHMQQRMMSLQLGRMNLLDPWTIWENLDYGNIGKPPAETIPDRIVEARKLGLQPGPTPEMMQMQHALAMAQASQALAQAGIAGAGGSGLPPVEAPSTSGVGPQGGRPPTGAKPPKFEMKDGGSRFTVSESG